VTAVVPTPILDRVTALRGAFDSAFSQPPRTEIDALEDLLAIRVGDTPYALRVSEVAGLHADRTVTPVPGSPPDTLGLAGFRGAIVAVYDLRVLLHTRCEGPCRWLVTAAVDERIAFAFDRFERHVRVPTTAIFAERGAAGTEPRETVHAGDDVRPIVRMSALLDMLNRSRGTANGSADS
jgi:chemotaxis signal transduction protein